MIRRIVCLLVAYLLMRIWRSLRAKTRNQLVLSRAAKKIQSRWASDLCQLPLVPIEDELRVLKMTVSQLRQSLDQGEFTATQLVSMYIRRCAHFGRRLNASTAEFFSEALNAAKECDDRRAAGVAPRLLEGIPVSIKDCFGQAGVDNTCGLASRVGVPETSDSVCVKLLVAAGAIPFVRTNVPPTLMAWETANNVFGTTLNPWNTLRTPGGSSGGEGALIAAGASPLGVGSDIGGSVRLPAHCCGIYSLKPTTRRVSTQGMGCQEVPGQTTILSSPGPMGKSVDDLVLVMKAWLGSEDEKEVPVNSHSLDPYSPPTPFRGHLFSPTDTTPLRIGVIADSGTFETSLPCARALTEAVSYLRTLPFVTIVDFKPPAAFSNARNLCSKVFVADDGEWLAKVLDGETPHPLVAAGITMGAIPFWLLNVLGWGLQQSLSTRRLGNSLRATFGRPIRSAGEMFELNDEITQLQRDFLAASSEVDVIICPTIGIPAPRHGHSTKMLDALYTGIFNILQWAAGHVPITTVRAEECHYDGQPHDAVSKICDGEMKGSKGLPVGIQVAGPPYSDEVVLRVMKILEEKFPFVLSPMGQTAVPMESEKVAHSSSKSSFAKSEQQNETSKNKKPEKVDYNSPSGKKRSKKQVTLQTTLSDNDSAPKQTSATPSCRGNGGKSSRKSNSASPHMKYQTSTSQPNLSQTSPAAHLTITITPSTKNSDSDAMSEVGRPRNVRYDLSQSLSPRNSRISKSESGSSLPPADLPIVTCPHTTSLVSPHELGGIDIKSPLFDDLSPHQEVHQSEPLCTLSDSSIMSGSSDSIFSVDVTRNRSRSRASDRELRLREEEERRMQQHEQEGDEEEKKNEAPLPKRVISDPKEFVKLLGQPEGLKDSHGKPFEIEVQGLYGRLTKGTKPAHFARLSTEDWKRLSWVIGPEELVAMLKIVQKGPPVGPSIAAYLGMLPEWVKGYLDKGFQFRLLVFSEAAGAAWPATWDGVKDAVRAAYPDLNKLITTHFVALKNTPWAEVQRAAGFNFLEISMNGREADPRYMSYARLAAKKKSATFLDVRSFLYFEIGLKELFRGDGHTSSEDGTRGAQEFLVKTVPVSQLNHAWFDIDMSPTNG